MQVVILAGGLGTRLSEYTYKIPKPMVKIGKIPILEHIMRSYLRFGYTDLVIPIGYKGSVIKDYFKNKVNKKFMLKYFKKRNPFL